MRKLDGGTRVSDSVTASSGRLFVDVRVQRAEAIGALDRLAVDDQRTGRLLSIGFAGRAIRGVVRR